MIKYILSLINWFRKFEEDDRPPFISNTSKDEPDDRDEMFAVSRDEDTMEVKYEIPNLPPIRSQKTIGSCASHAAIGCYEIQLSKRRFIEGSELFHYYNARKHVNETYPQDRGMTVRDACKTLYKHGFALEMTWPYDTGKFNVKPSSVAYAFSKIYKVKGYQRCYSIDDIEASIMQNIPVMCGIKVYRNYMRLDRNNYLYVPTPDGQKVGGHAVIIVGYDLQRSVFKMRNSWGTRWGNYGYFEMGYDDFKKYSFDWWRVLI